MVRPDFFNREAEQKAIQKRATVEQTLTSLTKAIQAGMQSVFSSSILRVKSEGQEENLLKKIIGELQTVSHSLKSLESREAGEQKISIKTPDLITVNKTIEGLLRSLNDTLAKKQLKVEIPATTRVTGSVKVENLPAPQRFPVEEIVSALKRVEASIGGIRLEVPKAKEVKIPAFPTDISFSEGKDILKALQSLTKKIDELPKNYPEVKIPRSVEVSNFPIQKVPQPVTNININPLRGFIKSRAVTVTTTATPLPEEVLAYRRSVSFYNNSAQTVYMGGSDVTVTNGIPVPASTWGPAIDAGPRLIVYGIVASSTANVRVMEVSNENIGG